jgi:putative transposase
MTTPHPAQSTITSGNGKKTELGSKSDLRLRDWVRTVEDRHPDASAGILDSQSVKTATMINQEVGYDAGKQIKGRKRFTLVDTFGLLIAVKVVAASVQEREGAKQIFAQMKKPSAQYPRLIRIFVDGGFSGEGLMRFVMDTFGLILDTVLRSDKAKGFAVLPKRWVVERTFGWFNYWRRLSKDYEVLPETSEAFIYIGMIRLMLRRLA